MSIQKEGDANTVTVARAVARELDRVEKDHSNLDLRIILDQGNLIVRSVTNVAISLLAGAVLAMLVLLVFLKHLRPTLIIGVAIPFSVIVTFVLMHFQGLTVNLMTLGGLALGVGMLVDNAIVVIENTYRRLNSLGEDPHVAARKGAEEVSGAITASTFTTVAVFLPVAFVGGLPGELFRELSLTVTFSLLASLAVSLTVIPMMAARFLKAPRPGRAGPGRTGGHVYTRVLQWVLGRRALTLAMAGLVLAGSLALAPRVGMEFMPVMDEGSLLIGVAMPAGTPLHVTAAKVDELALLLEQIVPVELITTTAGRGGGLGMGMASGGDSIGSITVTLKPGAVPTQAALKTVRERLEEVRGNAQLSYGINRSGAMGGSQSDTVQLSVTGSDLDGVRRLVGQVERQLEAVAGLANITNNLEMSVSEVQVVVNRERAAQNGLTPAQIAMVVADAVNGRIVTRIEQGGRSVDVRVMYRPEDREDTARLEGLLLGTVTGRAIPLRTVAEIRPALGPVSITRQGQRVSAQISARIEGRDLGAVTSDVMKKVPEMGFAGGLLGAGCRCFRADEGGSRRTGRGPGFSHRTGVHDHGGFV
ncbi:MAG: efflux RND transporter permease subunit [Bacillota bacterium]